MKLIHLADLHIGKRVNEMSMLEDQKDILLKILGIIDSERPDAVIIAGDVYDKSVPPAEAVEVFDDFLFRLAKRQVQVFIISGNHDSPERLAFGGRLMDMSGIHLSPVYNGTVEPHVLTDDHGEVRVYMLPFVKPANVRCFFEDREINTYTEALRTAVEAMDIDPEKRNVLITHQFVTGASRSDSEEISVGGSDNVDAAVFADFDYVALGHIHRPQNIGSERIRYSGTPLKYSFSEASHEKSVTVAQLGAKGELSIRTVPLTPLHDMKEIRGSYDELTARSFYDGTTLQEDYTHITLTDEEDIPDAAAKLRVIYHNLMKLDYDNRRTRTDARIGSSDRARQLTPAELFDELYELQNGAPMSDTQRQFIEELTEKIREGRE